MSSKLSVRLLSFASATEAIGQSEITLELEEGTTVADLKRLLEERYPSLGGLWHRLAVAIDGEVAVDVDPVPDGAEVALLPPVSGGSGGAVSPAVSPG